MDHKSDGDTNYIGAVRKETRETGKSEEESRPFRPIWSLRGVMVNVLACNTVVSEFELQLRYYVHYQANTFGSGLICFFFFPYGLNSSRTFLFEDGFSIK